MIATIVVYHQLQVQFCMIFSHWYSSGFVVCFFWIPTPSYFSEVARVI